MYPAQCRLQPDIFDLTFTPHVHSPNTLYKTRGFSSDTALGHQDNSLASARYRSSHRNSILRSQLNDMASATGIPEHTAHTEEEPLLGRPGDATQQPSRGLQFNFLIGWYNTVDRNIADESPGTAIIAQAGIWILTALVWASVFMADFSFFSYHPVRPVLCLARATC